MALMIEVSRVGIDKQHVDVDYQFVHFPQIGNSLNDMFWQMELKCLSFSFCKIIFSVIIKFRLLENNKREMGEIKMEILQPTQEDWLSLYEAAVEYKQLECWKWLTDEHVFGVQHPVTGEVAYCCVLGNNEEMYGLAVYIGKIGLDGLLKMQSGELEPGDSDVIHVQNCLMVSFDDRSVLEPDDLKLIKKLGLKFRGQNAWPNFRRYEPGYVPWILTTQEEVQYLTLVLQQATQLTQRYNYPLDTLFLSEDGEYLTRVSESINGSLHWSELWLKPELGDAPEQAEPVQYQIDELRLSKLLKTAKAKGGIWEIDSFYAPMPIKKGDRAYFPQMTMFLNQDEGLILHFHLSDEAGEQMNWGVEFVQLMERLQVMPEEVWVRKATHFHYIETILEKCKIAAKIVPVLPSIQDAKEEMFQFMGR
jgi:hypothetical protein